jgi:hypothetical protein
MVVAISEPLVGIPLLSGIFAFGVVWYDGITPKAAQANALRVLNDFFAWKGFGTGGSPPTWA